MTKTSEPKMVTISPLRTNVAPIVLPTEIEPISTSFWTSLNPTISDYLHGHNLPTDQLPLDFLDRPIMHNQPLDSDTAFVMAYYLISDNPLRQTLQLLLFDKTTQSWKRGEITRPDRSDEKIGPWGNFDFGDVMGVDESEHFYFVYLHGSPSGGWTLLLTHELEYYDFVFGSVRAVFDDGAIVYHEGMPHFVPTHFAQISLYDPDSNESRRIFPLEPHQSLWIDHVEKMRQVYEDLGGEWCKERGHHCLPELFNNFLAGKVVANDDTDSLAFIISFEPEWIVERSDLNTAVVYIYRNVHQENTMEWREVKQEDLQELFGEFELAELLDSVNLDLIFIEFEFFEN
ncbi:MAG: hypothetical protein GY796_19775 [Chloroflexi bacterium]|nr:hypothetical protein [Chloroflexota bacterium]